MATALSTTALPGRAFQAAPEAPAGRAAKPACPRSQPVRRCRVLLHAVAERAKPSGARSNDPRYVEFAKALDKYDFNFRVGDKVTGNVIMVANNGIYVDIGAKSAAFCPLAECTLGKSVRVRPRSAGGRRPRGGGGAQRPAVADEAVQPPARPAAQPPPAATDLGRRPSARWPPPQPAASCPRGAPPPLQTLTPGLVAPPADVRPGQSGRPHGVQHRQGRQRHPGPDCAAVAAPDRGACAAGRPGRRPPDRSLCCVHAALPPLLTPRAPLPPPTVGGCLGTRAGG